MCTIRSFNLQKSCVNAALGCLEPGYPNCSCKLQACGVAIALHAASQLLFLWAVFPMVEAGRYARSIGIPWRWPPALQPCFGSEGPDFYFFVFGTSFRCFVLTPGVMQTNAEAKACGSVMLDSSLTAGALQSIILMSINLVRQHVPCNIFNSCETFTNRGNGMDPVESCSLPKAAPLLWWSVAAEGGGACLAEGWCSWEVEDVWEYDEHAK